jgi:predicted methyltransferase
LVIYVECINKAYDKLLDHRNFVKSTLAFQQNHDHFAKHAQLGLRRLGVSHFLYKQIIRKNKLLFVDNNTIQSKEKGKVLSKKERWKLYIQFVCTVCTYHAGQFVEE